MTYHPEEFIGCELMVVDSNNKSQVGLIGKVVDETKKTFTIINKNKETQITKQGCTFTINGKTILGNDIAQRPEERIKKR